MKNFQLKEYQQAALDALSAYYRKTQQLNDADTAFYALTRRTYHQIKELPGLPYVCLRLPTGAGKTFVAAHAVQRTIKEYLQTDQGLVLWLVPSDTIREQTLNALKDRNHPYRRTLDQNLGSVTVIGVDEALYLPRPTLDTSTVIIVSTIQAFRVEDTGIRKVYETSGALMDHFSGYPAEVLERLEKIEGSHTPKYSLANVLRLRRPIVIVDEAHTARKPLSFETLARFHPASILELTATPVTDGEHPSNILYQVSAAELKAEDMIKLPIMLHARENWKELLADAIARLNGLATAAQAEESATGETLRPIMLLQAQPRNRAKETLTIDVVKETLLKDFNIPEEQIARHGQGYKELDDLAEDISSPKSPIRFVITVSALKEGWDCPSAYVLCSVAEMRSSTAIEQILGRVMRLPNAKRKQTEALNQAYAFAASANFAEVAQTLTDGLIKNGFERIEAEKLIQAPEQIDLGFDDMPLFNQIPQSVSIQAAEKPLIEKLPPALKEKVTLDEESGILTFNGHMVAKEKETLQEIYTSPAGKAAVESAFRRNQALYDEHSPAERGAVFSVPVLAFKQADFVEQFEQTHFLEYRWRLSQQDATLTEEEYPSQSSGARVAQIDITDEKTLQTQFLSNLHKQMRMLASDQGWTITDLVKWLDRTIPHHDIIPSESNPFILKVIQTLIDERGLSLDELVHDKYRLRQAVTAKIDLHRKAQHENAYQNVLFGDNSPVVVTPDLAFSYDPHRYATKAYQGQYKFHKHYYADVGDFDSQEELECAAYLDGLEEIEMWVRNPARGSKAFWLQTSSDKFYPDFVCKLEDGCYLVVEYKGANLWTNEDSKEKRQLGELWEKRSNGRCLFVMPKGKDFAAIKAKLN